ncbi:MAG: T9SS type A sorting domain-containing protein, partial [candidate division KSB1 bacterium]|nr:T9SS type A sorting domain-containing protein [candidate division KSB1 bacterium]
ILARNAARWLTEIIDWMTITPNSGTVAPGSSALLTARFDTPRLNPDSVYHAVVRIASTDFKTISAELPIRLTLLGNCVSPIHFQFTTTDEFYSIVIDAARIDDEPPGLCDEIAVFDGDLCVGAIPYSRGAPLALSAWRDDPATPEKDGFTPGNPMRFVMWDRSAGMVYAASAIYTIGDGNFGTAVFTRVGLLSARSMVSQQTVLPGGWQWISFFIDLDTLAAERAFSSLENLNIVTSETGEFFIPGKASTLAQIDLRKMYKVHLSAQDTLAAAGHPILTQTPIPVHQGWNWVAYYPSASLEPSLAFNSLGPNLIIVQNQRGEFFIPGVVNTIRSMSRGQGFTLYSGAADTLIYPKVVTAKAQAAITPDIATLPAKHFRAASPHGESYAIVIDAIRGIGRALTEEDEIAAFAEDGTLLGASRCQPNSINALAARGDDPLTPAKDGYRIGDRMRFVFWDHARAQEIELVADFQKGDAIIGNAPYTRVSLRVPGIPTRFALHPNFPNPFNPETHIRFDLPENRHVTLRIYNTLGQQIRVLIDHPYAAGYHQKIWDGKDGSGKPAPSGLYFYRIEAGEFSAQRKMTLIR